MLALSAPLAYAPDLRRALQAAALGALLVLPSLLFDPSPFAAFVVGLFALGLGRSGLTYRVGLGRGLFVELLLAGGAAVVATVPYGSGLFGDALAVWSFWLIQSVYGLFGSSARAHPATPVDPFERARAAVERLMQEP